MKKSCWIKACSIAIISVAAFGITLGILLSRNARPAYTYQAPREEPRVGAWAWSYYHNSTDDIINRSLEFGLDFLFMSIPPNQSAPETRAKTIDLITRCAENGIELHWMTAEHFATYFDHEYFLDEVGMILDFLEDTGLHVPGIHLDLEPNIGTKNRTELDSIFDDYLLLLSEIRELVDSRLGANRTTKLSAAICNCYHDPERITNGTAATMHRYLDFLVPMTYNDFTPEMYAKNIDPLIAEAPVVIGVGWYKYESFGAMMRALNSTAEHYQDDPNFLGFSVFHDLELEPWHYEEPEVPVADGLAWAAGAGALAGISCVIVLGIVKAAKQRLEHSSR